MNNTVKRKDICFLQMPFLLDWNDYLSDDLHAYMNCIRSGSEVDRNVNPGNTHAYMNCIGEITRIRRNNLYNCAESGTADLFRLRDVDIRQAAL